MCTWCSCRFTRSTFTPTSVGAGLALRWVITTPEFHHWHHTSDEEGLDRNFAGFLPLWDLAFGTAHQPGHWPKNYGTVKFQPPETYLGQLLYPFRRHGTRTPYG